MVSKNYLVIVHYETRFINGTLGTSGASVLNECLEKFINE
jgi:hypothetical protein